MQSPDDFLRGDGARKFTDAGHAVDIVKVNDVSLFDETVTWPLQFIPHERDRSIKVFLSKEEVV
jgi:hypothetical protein